MREHLELLAEKSSSSSSSSTAAGGEAMGLRRSCSSQQQQQQQQNKLVAAEAAAAPDGAGTVAEVDGKPLEQAIAQLSPSQLTQLAPLWGGFGAAETRDRNMYLTSGVAPMRHPVKVKANTKQARDREGIRRRSGWRTLRGARAEQWQEPLMKFVKEELDAQWNSGSEASPSGREPRSRCSGAHEHPRGGRRRWRTGTSRTAPCAAIRSLPTATTLSPAPTPNRTPIPLA